MHCATQNRSVLILHVFPTCWCTQNCMQCCEHECFAESVVWADDCLHFLEQKHLVQWLNLTCCSPVLQLLAHSGGLKHVLCFCCPNALACCCRCSLSATFSFCPIQMKLCYVSNQSCDFSSNMPLFASFCNCNLKQQHAIHLNICCSSLASQSASVLHFLAPSSQISPAWLGKPDLPCQALFWTWAQILNIVFLGPDAMSASCMLWAHFFLCFCQQMTQSQQQAASANKPVLQTIIFKFAWN